MLVSVTYEEYLTTLTWKATAHFAKERAGWRCQHPGCESLGPLHVHHLTYERVGQERDDDLLVLCAEHHRRYHWDASSQQMRLPLAA